MKQHYINGQWVQGQGASFVSVNPANGQIVWDGRNATEEEITSATDAARKALIQWSQLDISRRAMHLQKFAKQIELQRQDLILLIAKETGKPLWEAATEVNAVIAKVALSLSAYDERTAEKHHDNPDGRRVLRYKPHGVVAVIGPFNFPAHLSNGHIVPAILAGNTVVYKPSELTPGVAELILQCWHDSGLPKGVINCIQGGVNTATILLKQDLQGVFFTGSYQTAIKINQQFSDRPDVILALEMGGNNPLIIDEVDNIKAAVYNTLLSSFITAGQRCTCARRVLIPDSAIGDTFLNAFITATKSLVLGPYTKTPQPFMGPVISNAHAIAHLNAQQGLKNAGGTLLLSMSLQKENTGLLTPGIIDMTSVDNPIDDEIFAPLVQIHRYKNFESALTIANKTHYGLVAGLMSDNEEHYQLFYKTIRAGLVNWNKPTTGAASNLPFGGIGKSGNHRPSAYFAADYCAYPIASLEQPHLIMPTEQLPGIQC